MGKLEKATDFYLRGFGSQYIKRRTGISMQSLLKQLLHNGIKYTKEDIVQYQINYIKSKYGDRAVDEVKKAYEKIVLAGNLDSRRRSRCIEALGCAFGDYPRVFKAILGDNEYSQLRYKLWKDKQVESVRKKYGVDNVFDKSVFHDVVSDEAIANGRKKRSETLIARYGTDVPNQVEEFAQKMVEQVKVTCLQKYGVTSPMQVHVIASKAAVKRQDTMLKKYGAKNSTNIPSIRNKIFEARRKNGTLNTSLPEVQMGLLLIELFGADDVISNKIIDSRYPYHVDFYIKSKDLFIELNGDKCHNDHWFDSNSKRDRQILKAWQDNLQKAENPKTSRYGKYIKTWTQTDVDKRNKAKQSGINYLVFWDSAKVMRNGQEIARLSDFHEWVDAGCPMPQDWKPENTY